MEIFSNLLSQWPSFDHENIYAYKTQKPLTLNHEQGLDPQSTSNHGNIHKEVSVLWECLALEGIITLHKALAEFWFIISLIPDG
jgi:hypothetical protein